MKTPFGIIFLPFLLIKSLKRYFFDVGASNVKFFLSLKKKHTFACHAFWWHLTYAGRDFMCAISHLDFFASTNPEVGALWHFLWGIHADWAYDP